jgi:hypothetical protein
VFAQNNISDIEFLQTELPQKHINLFFKIDKQRFDNELYELSLNADSMRNFDMALSLQQIIAKMGDSHTGVAYNKLIDKQQIIPLKLYWFEDGIFVLYSTKQHEKIVGAKLTAIENHAVEEVIDSLKTLVVQDNNAMVKMQIPMLLQSRQILSFFGFVKTDSIVEISFEKDGNSIKEQFATGEKSTDYTILERKSTPLCQQNLKMPFWYKYMSDSVLYVQYNQCYGKEVAQTYGQEQEIIDKLPSFKEFENQLFNEIKNNKIRRFVFDMRYNGGGSSQQGTNFVNKLKKIKKINKQGILYVIIGRETFSSAIINTMDFCNETKAMLVGEETGGKPNHYGEVKGFNLLNSKILITYSTKYFQHTKENLNTISPDIAVKYTFNDYVNGIDAAMKVIEK